MSLRMAGILCCFSRAIMGRDHNCGIEKTKRKVKGNEK
jgi:hypothetical protein